MWKIGLLIFYLLILCVYDGKHKQVPVILLYIGVGMVTVLSVIELLNGTFAWLRLFGAFPGILLIIVACVTGKAGVADGIVLSIAGIILGYKEIWLLFCISLMLIFSGSVFLLLLRKIHMNTRMPYIPFMTVALLLQQLLKEKGV